MGGRGGAGFTGKGGAARRSQATRMARLYRSGRSLSQIASQTGTSSSTVHSRLQRAGVPLRGRGGQRRG